MLNDKNKVEEDGDVTEQELGRISSDATPVTLQAGIEDELQQRQNTSDEIQDNGPNVPSHRRLPPVVQPSLWDVLDRRNDKFIV